MLNETLHYVRLFVPFAVLVAACTEGRSSVVPAKDAILADEAPIKDGATAAPPPIVPTASPNDPATVTRERGPVRLHNNTMRVCNRSSAGWKCFGVDYSLPDATRWGVRARPDYDDAELLAMGADDFFTCKVLTVGGGVMCHGTEKGFGTGSGLTRNTFVPIPGLSGVTAIAASRFGPRACAVVAGVGLKCWGGGILGDNTRIPSNVPVDVLDSADAVDVAIGVGHTCFVLSSGDVKCWGLNFQGSLGIGTLGGTAASDVALAPVAVTGLGGVRTMAAGHFFTCAVLENGGVKCWGANLNGSLGDGTTTHSPTPVDVIGVSDVIQVAVAPADLVSGRFAGPTGGGGGGTSGAPDFGTTACALEAQGTVKCWGDNRVGQLGNGTNVASTTAVQVSGLSDVEAVTVGGKYACARLRSGEVKCWGRFVVLDASGAETESNVPVAVAGLP